MESRTDERKYVGGTAHDLVLIVRVRSLFGSRVGRPVDLRPAARVDPRQHTAIDPMAKSLSP